MSSRATSPPCQPKTPSEDLAESKVPSKDVVEPKVAPVPMEPSPPASPACTTSVFYMARCSAMSKSTNEQCKIRVHVPYDPECKSPENSDRVFCRVHKPRTDTNGVPISPVSPAYSTLTFYMARCSAVSKTTDEQCKIRVRVRYGSEHELSEDMHEVFCGLHRSKADTDCASTNAQGASDVPKMFQDIPTSLLPKPKGGIPLHSRPTYVFICQVLLAYKGDATPKPSDDGTEIVIRYGYGYDVKESLARFSSKCKIELRLIETLPSSRSKAILSRLQAQRAIKTCAAQLLDYSISENCTKCNVAHHHVIKLTVPPAAIIPEASNDSFTIPRLSREYWRTTPARQIIRDATLEAYKSEA
ncbi:hypothetical protein H4R35_006680 [Dimargaris xerosporica]|nr:hypothetical protein H4R35_006680 [Dimargaris xerosporica]